jgi:hypothetical protein
VGVAVQLYTVRISALDYVGARESNNSLIFLITDFIIIIIIICRIFAGYSQLYIL